MNWVIHFICLNMHGVDGARSKAAERLSSVKSPSDIKTPSLNLGFSHACALPDSDLIGERKKKFTHKATPAPCASHYRRSCCIFLWGSMLSFDTQRSHGVRDAPSHGNSFKRVREMRDRALTVKSIKQREGIQWFTLGHNDQSMICAQDFSPFLARRKICRSFSFCTERNWQRKLICMIGEQEHTVWSGKPDIYGWEIYPKMYERKKSLSTSSGE